jgi:hypothetical protein
MADSTFNFSVNQQVNANFDITWSFQYCVSGGVGSSGGFSTFLYNNPTLDGGGRYEGLGYAPHQGDYGVVNSMIGIMFDSNNIITVKGINFDTLTSFPLHQNLSPLVKSTPQYNTIRFNLTNSAQKLIISLKDTNNRYYEILNLKTDIPYPQDYDFYRVGFSYSTPLRSADEKIKLLLKDIHVQGSTVQPTTRYTARPVLNTNYILQSPLSSKIQISINNNPVGALIAQKP